MQVAKLTQDYYGFIRQAVSPNNHQAGTQQAEPKRPRPAVLPAERPVEGELLRNRQRRPGDNLDELLQRGRYSGNSGSPTEDLSAQAAQRAINTYLDNATSSTAGGAGRPQVVDYYA